MAGGKKVPLPKICHTYPTMIKLGTHMSYLKKIKKIHESRDTTLAFCCHHHFLPETSKFCYIKKSKKIKAAFWYIISNSFKFFESLKTVSMNVVTILMMTAKMATLGLLKIKLFWNKGYDVMISVHDFINKILSRDSNDIADLVTRRKFGNSSISMREVIITSIL